jgi:hypothetical protein
MCPRVALAVTVFSSTRTGSTMKAVHGVNAGTLSLRVALTVTLGSLATKTMTLTMMTMTSFARLI